MGYYIFNKRLFYSIVTNLQVFFLKSVDPRGVALSAISTITCQYNDRLPVVPHQLTVNH